MKMSMLEKILDAPKGLTVRFQPIFDYQSGTGRIDSLEGLIRGPAGTNFERADVFFDYVRRKHAEAAADRACIAAITRSVAELPDDFRININVHAITLGQNLGFVDFFCQKANNLALPIDHFTLEIVEHSPTHNVPGLIYTLRALRDLGVRIALDDVGLGHANYRMILDCHPDYFKLDGFFVEGVSCDADRRAVVESVMCLAEKMKTVVVAEGVRSNRDLSTLIRMGVNLFQANLLCPALRPEQLAERGVFGNQPGIRPTLHSKMATADRTPSNLIAPAVGEPVCQ